MAKYDILYRKVYKEWINSRTTKYEIPNTEDYIEWLNMTA